MSKLKELLGKRFGRLVVIDRDKNSPQGKARWKVLCDCGKEKIVVSGALTSGLVISCGCSKKEKAKERSLNLVGKIYGNLEVIGKENSSKDRHVLWSCRCSCGSICVVSGSKLVSGHTTSCGCYRKTFSLKHGLTGTREIKAIYEKRRRDKEKLLDSNWSVELDLFLRKVFPFCVVCRANKDLTIDHVKPLSKGYGLSYDNAVVLCRSCNAKKKDRELDSLPSYMREAILDALTIFDLAYRNEFLPEENK